MTSSPVYWGLLLSAGPLTVVARMLHLHTHHRPLGAVTFVLVATAIFVAGALLARRCKEQGPTAWRACRVAALISALAAMLATLLGG